MLNTTQKEIRNYIENTERMYGTYQAINKNLLKHCNKYRYDHNKATKSFYNLIVEGLKGYTRDYCTSGTKWYSLLNVEERYELAEEMLEDWECENITEIIKL